MNRVEINPSSTTLDEEEGKQFTAISYDQNNDVLSNVTYSWSVVNGGGSIGSYSGYFTAGNIEGTFTNTVKVTAKLSGVTKYDFATVIVNEIITQTVLDRVEINPPSVILNEGAHQQFSATAYDQSGNIITGSVTYSWSVINGGGSIGSYSGYFTAGNIEGTFTNTVKVTAKLSGVTKYDFATVIVNEIITQTVLDRVEIFPPSITISTNQSFDFDAQAYDNNNSPVFNDVTYYWSVISGPGSVNQNGLYSATDSTGTATLQVRATQGNINRYDTAIVTITGGSGDNILNYVTISPQTVYLYPGEAVDFDAQAYDNNGYPVSATYTWYVVDNNAGSINQNGYFIASNNIGSYYNSVRVKAYKDGRERSDYADVVIRTSHEDYSINTSLVATDENGGTAKETDVILYTLRLTNNRNNRLTNVETTFALPNNTSFVSATSTSGAPRISNRTISWSAGELAVNQTKTMSLRVQINSNVPRYTVISGKTFVQATELDTGMWVYANDITVAGTGPTEPLTPTGVMNWLLAIIISLLATVLTRKIFYTRRLLNR